MDERRGDQPAAGSRRTVPRQIRAGLSPLQQSYAHFTDHFVDCQHCREVGRGRCPEGDQLWQAYQAEDARVQQQMTETP